MGFFAEVPPPEPEPPRQHHPWELPEDEFPGIVPAGPLLLGRTSRVAVGITSLAAYTSGFEILISARTRPGAGEVDERPVMAGGHESFRLGLQLSDGHKVIFSHRGPDRDTEPDGPILWPYAFGGGRRHRFSRWWAWPLPPAGPLDFVCEWAPLGVPESRARVAAELIRDAAQRSIRLWSPDGN